MINHPWGQTKVSPRFSGAVGFCLEPAGRLCFCGFKPGFDDSNEGGSKFKSRAG